MPSPLGPLAGPARAVLKAVLKATVYRPGRTVTIRAGPLRGCRYVVNERSGWAPIYGGWEPAAQEAYRRLVGPGQVAYDLGANTGIHALLLSRLVGPRGAVFAFEPLPENVREIESLRALNAAGNLRVLARAVGAAPGTAAFQAGGHPKQGHLVDAGADAGRVLRVAVTTLDAEIAAGLPPPDFVKVDVEGAEADVLDGYAATIARSYPTLAIDLHAPEQDRRVGRFLGAAGYRVYRLRGDRAAELTGQTALLAEIPDLASGWPDPRGVWGTVVAVHPSRHPDGLPPGGPPAGP
jgi:FkbM family methyltransferase